MSLKLLKPPNSMTVDTISRPFIGSPPTARPWSHRIATKLFHACRRSQLNEIEGLRPLEEERPIVVATHQQNSEGFSSHIKLVCIADTHNARPELPYGDILLHAGDLSQYGTFDEIQAQLKWLAAQPHKHKIVVAGNHDLLLDKDFVDAHPDRELERHPGKRRADLDWGDIHYLQHDSVQIKITNGSTSRLVKVFGSPWTPRMGSWAFQYGPKSPFSWKGAILGDADVVLVHGPPAEHLDAGGKGCEDLLAELWRVRPQLMVCGHIHAGRGHEVLLFDRLQGLHENVALGRGNWMASMVMLGFYTLWLALLGLVRRPREVRMNSDRARVQPTWLVNAAVAGGRADGKQRSPYTVLI